MQMLHGSIAHTSIAAAQQSPICWSQRNDIAGTNRSPRQRNRLKRNTEMAYVNEANLGLIDRVRGVIADLAERAARAKVYRTTMNELSGRELADLGIHRSEIKRIAYEAAYKN
jgi:uncharacterized protein YjiS (DUF1127 family)